MAYKGEYDFRIQPSDIDFTRKVTLVSIIDYLLDAAGQDADRNGFGLRDLNLKNCSWVLSLMALELDHHPTQYEKITIKTWVPDVNRIMTTRNLELYTGEGERFGSVVTLWSIIDLDNRKPVDISRMLDYTHVINTEPSAIEKPRRLPSFESAETVVHPVVYSDIDFNRHTNSMKYIEWMLDMVHVDHFEGKEIVRADINFLHESRFGDILTVVGKSEEGDTFHFEVAAVDNTPVCRASFRWREKR